MDDLSTIDGTQDGSLGRARRAPAREVFALVLAYCRDEPHRVGEIALVDGEQILGRGGPRPDDTSPRVRLLRQRPGRAELTAPLGSPRLSRAQLRLVPRGDKLAAASLGRCALLVDGEPRDAAEVSVGSTLQLGSEVVFLVSRRPEQLPPLRSFAEDSAPAFGEADRHGVVGESPSAWRLRDACAFVARSEGHVLILGESGTGKELVAAALHALSSRGARQMVSRSAATFPEGLVDVELFGNAKNYPNPGTPERSGLIGEADGSSLFLDEIGELPVAMQAHLLRVLDRRGEYQRLGEAESRRADLRVIAATHRPIEALKHDFAARFSLRIKVPSLDERRDDLPLLMRHLLRRAAAKNPHVAEAFFEREEGSAGEARVSASLVERLLRHSYRLHLRELDQLLWLSLTESPGSTIELTEGVERHLDASQTDSSSAEDALLTKGAIEASLTRAGGSVTQAARALGLKNRFVLYRLMRKLGVGGGEGEEPPDEE